MKAYIDIVDKYPVFELVKKSSSVNVADVTSDQLASWKSAIKNYNIAQAQMKRAVDPEPSQLKRKR
jgi:hypothetical protein